MSDERPDDTSEDAWPKTRLSSFMRTAIADQRLTFKAGKWLDEDGKETTLVITLPDTAGKPPDTGEVLWPKTSLGPFRYAIVGGGLLEFKDGRWVDENGEERTVTIAPPNNVAAHRP